MRSWILLLAMGCSGGTIKESDTESVVSDTDSTSDTEDQTSDTEDCTPSAETDDGTDEDCDGLVDEDFLAAGDVLVSEFLAMPDPADGDNGEWIEVVNTSSRDVDLLGWEVTTGSGSFTINESLVLAPGAYAVLAQTSSATVLGVTPDFVWDAVALSLDDSTDTITLTAASEVFSLTYDAYWPKYTGYATALDPDNLDASAAIDVSYWCYPSSQLANGTFGTPGEDNDRCSGVDHDGDGVSEDDGDCDDDDADVSPENPEVADGDDDNCNGAIDEEALEDLADGFLEGDNSLGYHRGLSVGDVDDDGEEELLVGGVYSGSYYPGAVYVLSKDEFADWDGDITTHDDAVLEGTSYYHEIGSMGPRMADNSGDGVADLFVGAYNYSSHYCTGCAQALLVHGGSHISGKLAAEDADVSFGGVSGGINRAMSHADFDGDGVSELVFSDPNADGGYTGAVYLFDASALSGAVDLADADTTLTGSGTYSYGGQALGSGDLDGDGHDDLLVSAAGSYYTSSSAVYLFYGDGRGFDDGVLGTDQDVELSNGDSSDAVGLVDQIPVADLDGDGQDDLVLAAPGNNRIHLFFDADFAGTSYDTTDSDAVISAEGISSYFGYAVAVGDVDGDGTADLLAGAPDYYSAYYASYYADDGGLALLFTDVGEDATLDDAAWVLSGPEAWALTGLGVLLTDLDGDGDDDSVIAAPGAGDGVGRVYTLESE